MAVCPTLERDESLLDAPFGTLSSVVATVGSTQGAGSNTSSNGALTSEQWQVAAEGQKAKALTMLTGVTSNSSSAGTGAWSGSTETGAMPYKPHTECWWIIMPSDPSYLYITLKVGGMHASFASMSMYILCMWAHASPHVPPFLIASS